MNKTSIPPVKIDEKEYAKFKFLVKDEGFTVSEKIREMIEKYNSKRVGKKGEKFVKDFINKYGIKTKNPPITSQNYKQVLYGNS